MVTVLTRNKIDSKKEKAPPLRGVLKVMEQQNPRKSLKRQYGFFTLLVIGLVVIFSVVYLQAKLVSPQQDLDLINERIEKLELEKSALEKSVNESSAPNNIISKAEELGMVKSAPPVSLNSLGS